MKPLSLVFQLVAVPLSPPVSLCPPSVSRHPTIAACALVRQAQSQFVLIFRKPTNFILGLSSVEIRKSIILRFFFHSKKRPTRRLLNLSGKTTCMYPRVDNDNKRNICERSRSLTLSGLEMYPKVDNDNKRNICERSRSLTLSGLEMYPQVDNDNKRNICKRSRSLTLSGLELAPRFFKVAARKDSKKATEPWWKNAGLEFAPRFFRVADNSQRPPNFDNH